MAPTMDHDDAPGGAEAPPEATATREEGATSPGDDMHRGENSTEPQAQAQAPTDTEAGASRKRPPEQHEGGPAQRPRTEAPPPSVAAAASPSRVQEAADGIINLATTHYRPDTNLGTAHNNSYYPPSAPVAAPALDHIPHAPGTAQGAHFGNSVASAMVHLSVVTSRPSFTEPWRKFPPEASVGTGAVIAWNECVGSGEAGVPNPVVHPPGQGADLDGAGGGKLPTSNEPTGNGGSKISGVRILTNASSVQYATSIRARTPSSAISVGCSVEWISLAMDLAVLTVDAATLGAVPLPVHAGLLAPGEEVACVHFQEVAMEDMASSMSMPRHLELDVQRGTVAGYYADAEHHHLLRMKLHRASVPTAFGGQDASNSGGGGGVVVDRTGRIAGLQSVDGGSIVPGAVIGLFLGACSHGHGVPAPPQPTAALAPCCHGHPDGSAGDTSRDTGDETSGSRTAKPSGAKPTKQPRSGVKVLPGIPTLGITGVQTLENPALRRSLDLVEREGAADTNPCGVRILGINHTVHPNADAEYASHCKEDKKCHASKLRTDDVLLALDGEPIRSDGTVSLAPGRDTERVDFRWLVARRPAGSEAKLAVLRRGQRTEIQATLHASRQLVPARDEGDGAPSYVLCGGCVFVPLTRAWLSERREQCHASVGGDSRGLPLELQGFRRYLHEQRKGDQQVIVLSHVLADEVNVGYHGMGDMVLTAVNGQRPVNNLQHLVELLVKKDSGQSLEFRCSCVHMDRAKVVICMDSKEVADSETRIMSNYMIDSWCSNALAPALRKEAEGKAHRHGVTCGLKTMRALRNAVRETTLVPVRRAAASKAGDDSVVAATRRIMDLSEAHKMQSAPLFAGKYTEEGGWTQVKTKHLSQLCACGKSTRFYCICTVGVMRCKDCFIQHCRDHTSQHECSEACAPNCEGVEVLAEGVELVTTKKRKRNNPTQAIQSRCVVCKAKTCYCCSACGFEKEIALCHVSTGRNCLAIHASELHNPKCPV